MKVRIVALPTSPTERLKSELDLTNFQLGGVYEVDATAAAYLVACQLAVYELRSRTTNDNGGARRADRRRSP